MHQLVLAIVLVLAWVAGLLVNRHNYGLAVQVGLTSIAFMMLGVGLYLKRRTP